MRIRTDRNKIAELTSHFNNNLLPPDLRFTMTTNPDTVVGLTAAWLYGSAIWICVQTISRHSLKYSFLGP